MSAIVTNSPQIARGHQEPVAVQFSVFLSNRVGQFKDVLDAIAAEDIQVLGVSVVDSTDWAVLRILVSDPNKAREVFRRHGLACTETHVLLPVLPEDGSLAEICGLLLQAEINVHFAYPLAIRYDDNPIMVFHVDESILATDLLTRHGIVLLGSEDLADPT